MRAKWPWFLGLFLTLVLGFFLFVTSPLWRSPEIVDAGRGFLFGSKDEIYQDSGRTNFVLLGLDSRSEGVPALTDTVLFFSLDHTGEQHFLLSLPRDIWIPQMRARLNTAYYYGNEQEGDGLGWTKRFVSEIVGQPVHYSIAVTFSAFTDIVDLLGGLDVHVERSFVDERYPIPGREMDDCDGDMRTLCRWETIAFEQGWQHMDGARALKFARSRYAEGDEGTDFARAGRQRRILLSAKERILSPDFLLNPEKTEKLLGIMERNIESDVPQSHVGPLARLGFEVRKGEVVSEAITEIDEEGAGFLVNPPISDEYDRQWIFIPEDSWGGVHKWVACFLEKNSECDTLRVSPSANLN